MRFWRTELNVLRRGKVHECATLPMGEPCFTSSLGLPVLLVPAVTRFKFALQDGLVAGDGGRVTATGNGFVPLTSF